MPDVPHGMSASTFGWHTRVCRSKVRYRTHAEARDFARHIKRKFNARQKPYECTCCFGWHLRTKKATADE